MMQDDDYFDSEEFKDILTAYEESVSSGAPLFLDSDDLIDIADYYNMNGHHGKAMGAVDAALELSPGATLPLVYKAREALAAGDVEEAEALSASIDDKDDPDFKFLQGEIMVANDKIDEADEYLKRLLDATADDEKNDFRYDTACLYLDYGVYDKAVEWAETCSETDSEALDVKGRGYFGIGEYEKCASVFESLLDGNPRSMKYWLALGNAQYMLGHFGDAMASSEFALALSPGDSNGLLLKAHSLMQLGNYEAAIDFYERYIKANPDDSAGELNLGKCLMQLNRYDDALRHMANAAALSKKNDDGQEADAYEAMAFVYNAMGRNKDAMEYMEKAVGSEEENDTPEAYIVRGHILMGSNHERQALAMFVKATVKSNFDPKVMLRIIMSLIDNGQPRKAYILYKLYTNFVNGNFKEAYPYMALCCWQMKKGGEFLNYLRKAVKNNPQETKAVLSSIIPESVSAETFLKSIIDKLKKQ